MSLSYHLSPTNMTGELQVLDLVENLSIKSYVKNKSGVRKLPAV